MKKECSQLFLIAMVLLLTMPLFAQQAQTAQPSYPDIPFESSPDFLKLPDNLYLGEVAGVAVNSKGHVFVYHRTGSGITSRLFEFDQTGKYVREIGQDLYAFLVAEQVRVDAQDNIWIVDQGSNMVIKFTPQGRVAMTFGRRPEPPLPPNPGAASAPPAGGPPAGPVGAGAPRDSFNRPADIAWDPAGNMFIADGNGNSRIAKFDKNGRFVKSWGFWGPEVGQFRVPHSIAVDGQGNVYVADRGNRRIQVFDNDGNFKTEFRNIQTTALCISSGTHQYLYSGNTNGEIYKMELNGEILGKVGKPGKLLKEFDGLHAIDCNRGKENEIFVGEFSWRVQKLTLRPGQSQSSK